MVAPGTTTTPASTPPGPEPAFNTPQQVAALAVGSGTSKANLAPPKALVGGFLAGAYIGFGALLAMQTSAGMSTDNNLITLVTGVTFSLGLILVVIAGSELLTGNMALVPIAEMAKRVTVVRMLANWLWVTIGNQRVGEDSRDRLSDHDVVGNAVGAGLFVAAAYWFLYGRTVPAPEYADATMAGRNGHRTPVSVR